ncbi:MAG TPA: NADH-quinone oxidoreductase subunit N [Anaerolineales bacterium]|nr:NADH-quinone oxidoreductase subunit N [Anaerolineales bacterium]
MNFNSTDFLSILPLTVLAVWASVLLVVDLFIPGPRKTWTAILSALGLLVALVLTAVLPAPGRLTFGGMISADGFASFLSMVVLVSGMLGIALSYDYLKRMGIERGEYYTLMLFSISGIVLMAYAADLIVVFLALELLSIPLYILAGFARPRLDSEESALKYFLLGAFASGFVVYGIALAFGSTATTSLQGIVAAVEAGTFNPAMLTVGAALILVGLGFKVGAVPFHMWTPDVYQGAPSTVTAFMAVGAKVGGFAALLRIFVSAFGTHYILIGKLTPVLWGVAAVTMIVGNVLAISQKNIKRMLAYSSIAHAGYILMALVPFAQPEVASDSIAAALFYLLGFAITSFGIWAVVMTLENAEDGADGLHKGLTLDDYAGLGRRSPGLAIAMTIFMLSFIGLPPTLGFAGKLFLFRTALEGGFVGLAVIGVLTSLISAYYYLRIVVIMYMQDGQPTVYRERWLGITAMVSALCTVALMFFASPLLKWAAESMVQLF